MSRVDACAQWFVSRSTLSSCFDGVDNGIIVRDSMLVRTTSHYSSVCYLRLLNSLDRAHPSYCLPYHTSRTGWTTFSFCVRFELRPQFSDQLGPSALAGFSFFLLAVPLQERVMSTLR